MKVQNRKCLLAAYWPIKCLPTCKWTKRHLFQLQTAAEQHSGKSGEKDFVPSWGVPVLLAFFFLIVTFFLNLNLAFYLWILNLWDYQPISSALHSVAHFPWNLQLQLLCAVIDWICTSKPAQHYRKRNNKHWISLNQVQAVAISIRPISLGPH